MNSLCDQLTEAYRQEERLYLRVRELVEEQNRIMEANADPSAVLELCNQVEGLLVEVAVIEEAIKPAKKQWEQTKQALGGELDSVLATIQTAIEETTRTQEQVRQRLLDYLRLQRERTDSVRADINASKARLAYGSD